MCLTHPRSGPIEFLTSPVLENDQTSHSQTGIYRAGNLDHHGPEYYREQHSPRPSRTEVSSRELAMLEVFARGIEQAASEYALRSSEDDTELVSRSLERRHKKKETKTRPPKPATTTKSSAPDVPSKPKKKHHVDVKKVGSVLGKVAKGLKFFRFFLREDDPGLYARLFEGAETLGEREEATQELRRRIVDALM